MFGISPMELAIIALIIMIIFGAGKLPKVIGELGKGIKTFKKEVVEPMEKEETDV